MTEPESLENESFTAWHPMLVALLEFYLPSGWKLVPELLLSRLPQRIDIVILRLTQAAAGTARKLHSVFDHLRPHTLIEHKGPTDDLDPSDALTLLAYAGQYMRLAKVSDPNEVCLLVICDRIPPGFVKQVERMGGTLERVGAGLWRGRIAGMLLRGIETREAYRVSPSEHLLYTFSRGYLTYPNELMPLDPEDVEVYTLLYQQVEQFKKKRGRMAIRDIEAAERSYHDVYEALVAQASPELRVRGLTPEQRLAGLPPEQRLAGLPPEQRLAGLPPEQRLAGLTPEQILGALSPEQILGALSPEALEQLARKLHR
jgi:hypothetical protein